MASQKKRKKKGSTVITFRAPPEFVEALDEFMAAHEECPSRSTAIRVLCLTALEQPAMRTMASEVFTEWSGIERQFFRAAFANFRENFNALMASVLAERGWSEDLVHELLEPLRSARGLGDDE